MRNKGFTLIETMIVVAMLGILLAVVTSAILKYKHRNDPVYNFSFGTKVEVINGFYKGCVGETIGKEAFGYQVRLTECGLKTVDLTTSIETKRLKTR